MAKSNKESVNSGDGTQTLKCELRSGPIAGTAIVQGQTFAQRGLQYAEVDGLAIFEGDIVLGTVAEMQADVGARTRSIGITGPQVRWPNAIIPYDLAPGLTNPQRVTDAIAHWEANTRIRFVLRTAANQAQYPDFVRFQNGGGCSAAVGRRGGMQFVTLGPACTTGNTIHEIGHTVGLWHEQSRQDRDTFVRIVWANIAPDMQHNFDQHISDGDDLGAYDYGSIMHYPLTAFSINGQPTIVTLQPVPPGVVIGQRNGLSAGDIAGVAAMYPNLTTIKEFAKDPINDTIKEVGKDPVFDTAKEVRKDPVVDGTIKEVRKDPVTDTIKEIIRDPIIGGGGGTLVENTTIPGIGGGIPGIGGGIPGIGGGIPGVGGGIPGVGGGATPFVMAGQSQFGNQESLQVDLSGQLQALAQALAAAQAQLNDITAAYMTLAQTVEAMQGQSGT